MNDLIILLVMIFALGALGTLAGIYFKKRGSKLGQHNPSYGYMSLIIILAALGIFGVFLEKIFGH